jgi:hypothetical protein
MSPGLYLLLIHNKAGSYSSPIMSSIQECINHIEESSGFMIQFKKMVLNDSSFGLSILALNKSCHIPEHIINFSSNNVILEKNRLIDILNNLFK